MKKFIIGIGIVFATILVALIIVSATEPKVESMSSEKLEAKFANKESFVLVIGTTTCYYCNQYKSNTLPKYVKRPVKGMNLYFVYQDEAYPRGTISELEKYGVTFTDSPTTYIVLNGQVATQKSGYLTINELREFVKENK